MKKLLLMASMFLIYGAVKSQTIGNVRFTNGYAEVYDERNNKIAEGGIGQSSDLFDFSSCFVVVWKDGYVTLRDQRLNTIAEGKIGQSGDSFKAVGCNIIVKRKDGFTTTWDKKLSNISSGY